MSKNRGEYSKVMDVEDGSAYKTELTGDVPVKKNYRRMSCCKLTCYIVLGCISFVILMAVAAGTYGYFHVKNQVKRFTVTEPQHLLIHELPEAELAVLKDRAKLFADEIVAGQVPEQDLTVTADELNGLIASSDFLRGNAYVTLHENAIATDWSLPTDGLPGGKGRYFVASGLVQVTAEEGNSPGEGHASVSLAVDTLQPVKDLSFGTSLLSGEFSTYWRRSTAVQPHELVVNLEHGHFLNWVAPEDYIAKRENLVHDLYEEEHDDHHHHHHGHHRGHHHHHHHHDDDDDDCHGAAILEGIASISIHEGSLTIHARRSNYNNNNSPPLPATDSDPAATPMSSSNHHGRRAARKLLKLLF